MTETLTEQEWKEESTRLHNLARTHQNDRAVYDALRGAADKAWERARALEEKRIRAEADKPETLTREESFTIEGWYRWYLESPGGKWANAADQELLHKLARMAR